MEQLRVSNKLQFKGGDQLQIKHRESVLLVGMVGVLHHVMAAGTCGGAFLHLEPKPFGSVPKYALRQTNEVEACCKEPQSIQGCRSSGSLQSTPACNVGGSKTE